MELRSLRNNKRGQVESIILAIITIFILGLIIFFFSNLNKQLYDALDVNFEANPTLNDTEAHQTLQNIRDVEGSNLWDWGFLAIFIGINIQMVIFSFASRQNLAFFWLFVIIGLVVLLLGVILSNIWQGVVANPEFATTLLRFPITNAIIGSYFPTIITGVFFLTLIVLFGKFPGRQE